MRKYRDYDDLMDRIDELSIRTGTRAAIDFIRRVLDDDSFRPDDVSRAELLVQLGEFFVLIEDEAAAGIAFHDAVADESEARIDARASLLSWCLRNGQDDEAASLTRDLRRARSGNPLLYHHVGETFEEHDNLAAASTWFTAGLERVTDDLDLELLAVGRRRVRERMGFPPDEYDQLAHDLMAERRAGYLP